MVGSNLWLISSKQCKLYLCWIRLVCCATRSSISLLGNFVQIWSKFLLKVFLNFPEPILSTWFSRSFFKNIYNFQPSPRNWSGRFPRRTHWSPPLSKVSWLLTNSIYHIPWFCSSEFISLSFSNPPPISAYSCWRNVFVWSLRKWWANA